MAKAKRLRIHTARQVLWIYNASSVVLLQSQRYWIHMLDHLPCTRSQEAASELRAAQQGIMSG